jgi:ElaB/YqjD/DUF883 family membrane-anchored ribosome-binding protein
MDYSKSWTQPGQSAPRLDQELPIISEEEVLRYLQKNLDDQAQVDEIFGKIKKAVSNVKSKVDFHKNKSALARAHGKHATNHMMAGTGKKRGDPVGDAHAKAQKAHELAKKAAEKGDHDAYKKHSAVAMKLSGLKRK